MECVASAPTARPSGITVDSVVEIVHCLCATEDHLFRVTHAWMDTKFWVVQNDINLAFDGENMK